MANESKWIIAGLAGAFLGAWWRDEQFSRATRSRAQIDDPETAEDARAEISELLEIFEIPDSIDSESEFHELLAEYLEELSEFEIEVAPDTPHGKPDILIGGVLALEIKYQPKKTEFDRLIGQCARYSREWDTWIILINTPESRIRDFEELLEDKGLEYIPILAYKTEQA